MENREKVYSERIIAKFSNIAQRESARFGGFAQSTLHAAKEMLQAIIPNLAGF
jgi:hypothetical protein